MVLPDPTDNRDRRPDHSPLLLLLLLYIQEIEPRTGWHLGNFPGPSRTWRSFNACAHLIRENERIGVYSASWRVLFDDLMFLVAGRFARVEPRCTACELVLGLLSPAQEWG